MVAEGSAFQAESHECLRVVHNVKLSMRVRAQWVSVRATSKGRSTRSVQLLSCCARNVDGLLGSACTRKVAEFVVVKLKS